MEKVEFVAGFLALIFIILSILIVLKLVIEPLHIWIFKKPLYIHGYVFLQKISTNQKEILKKEFPFYNRLSDRKKLYFEHRVRTFVNHYQFISSDSFIQTEEIKMIISGTYVMLSFGMRNYLTPTFHKIILQPDIYFSTVNNQYHKGEFNPHMKAVVFSWPDFLLVIKLQIITSISVYMNLHTHYTSEQRKDTIQAM